jgi:gluconate kinase
MYVVTLQCHRYPLLNQLSLLLPELDDEEESSVLGCSLFEAFRLLVRGAVVYLTLMYLTFLVKKRIAFQLK